MILWLLHKHRNEPMYGYKLKKQIICLTEGHYSLKPGVIYTVLRRMETKGLVNSEWETLSGKKEKRVYTLTSEGITLLKNRLYLTKVRLPLLEQLVEYYDAVLLNEPD